MYHLLWLSLGIPILIHLMFRRRSRRIPFSSLYFLRLVDQRIARRQKIKQWLLLATRMLLLAAVIAALARPLLRTSQFGGLNVNTTAAIILDNSYSMQAVHNDSSSFERGRKAALDVLDQLVKGDAATLLTATPEADRKLGVTSDLTMLRRVIDDIDCGWGRTDLSGAVRRAVDSLAEATTPRRELFLITDMQKLGWTESLRESLKELPEHTEVFLIDVGAPAGKNLGLTQATTGLRVAVKDVPTRIRVSLRNTGPEVMSALTRLVIEERRVGERVVSVAPGGSRTDAFAWDFDEAGYAGGYFQLDADSLDADNRRYFALRIHEKIPVLVVNGDPSPISFNDECFFLTAALRVSTHNGRSLSPIEPAVINGAELAREDLTPFKVVILANVRQIDAAAVAQLRTFGRRGGGIMFFLGPNVDIPLYNTALWEEGGEDALFPARLARTVNMAAIEPNRPYETIMSLRGSHLAMRDIADELDLSSGRIKSYVLPMMDEKGAGGTVLLRLANGQPLLIEKKMGAGSVFLWTSSADLDWNNMALKPFFLPLLHQLVYYMSRSGSDSESMSVGSVRRFRPGNAPAVMVERIAGPDAPRQGQPVRVETGETGEGRIARFDGATVPGLYRAHWKVGEDGEESVLFAVNVDTEESDLARIEPGEAAEWFEGKVRIVEDPDKVLEAISIEREGLPLWDYLFALAVVLAVLESFIANRWVRG